MAADFRYYMFWVLMHIAVMLTPYVLTRDGTDREPFRVRGGFSWWQVVAHTTANLGFNAWIERLRLAGRNEESHVWDHAYVLLTALSIPFNWAALLAEPECAAWRWFAALTFFNFASATWDHWHRYPHTHLRESILQLFAVPVLLYTFSFRYLRAGETAAEKMCFTGDWYIQSAVLLGYNVATLCYCLLRGHALAGNKVTQWFEEGAPGDTMTLANALTGFIVVPLMLSPRWFAERGFVWLLCGATVTLNCKPLATPLLARWSTFLRGFYVRTLRQES
jgi:hypothetical protein